ncbi:MAG: YjcQ family protein [Peptostreptococcaceae bacterium]
MGLDTKQKVLIAIYTEYQKDIPNIDTEVKYDKLGIGLDEFKIAIAKLENEGLIRDTRILKRGNSKWGIGIVLLDRVKMTVEGIDYVENKLGIEKTLNGLDKVKKVGEKCATWGWNEFKDITVQVVSEMGKHSIDKVLEGK